MTEKVNDLNRVFGDFKTFTDNLMYPRRCVMCDEMMTFDPLKRFDTVCSACFCTLSYVREPVCMKCGKEIDDEETEYCEDCSRLKRTFVKGFPVFNYVPPVSDSVIRIKYQGRKEYIPFYAREIIKKHGSGIRDAKIGLIVSVPLHKKKLKKRGFNQAGELARELSRLTGIPWTDDLLVRRVNTRPQKALSNEEREKNISTAFSVSEEWLRENKIPENVLVVDDIYTTGATIEGCAHSLYKAGAGKVYYTSICIGKV